MPQPEYKVHTLKLDEFDSRLISAWHELESQAIEPNGYLSPHFVIPAARHITNKDRIFGVLVERINRGGHPQLSGLGLFHLSKPSRHFPLPHLTAFHSHHSLLSGFLASSDAVENVLHHIFEYLIRQSGKWHALVIHNHLREGISATTEADIANNLGIRWANYREWTRATLRPQEIKGDLSTILSKNARKSMNRRMRRLEELGKVDWKIRYSDNLNHPTIERFLHLEHLGWKGERRTSILSNSADKDFFLEMMTSFDRSEKAFATELTLNDQPISSTVNFVSGNAGFAFKIGWDPAYSKFSPGVLNEIKWLECNDDFINGLQFIDSGSSEDASYINSLWPHQRAMRSGAYAFTYAGKLALPFVSAAAKTKNTLKSKKMSQQKVDN
jgi:CelD/BcsL family acetyltransferase involved in cellulose biosynthesis